MFPRILNWNVCQESSLLCIHSLICSLNAVFNFKVIMIFYVAITTVSSFLTWYFPPEEMLITLNQLYICPNKSSLLKIHVWQMVILCTVDAAVRDSWYHRKGCGIYTAGPLAWPHWHPGNGRIHQVMETFSHGNSWIHQVMETFSHGNSWIHQVMENSLMATAEFTR